MTIIIIQVCWIIPCLALQIMSGLDSSAYWGYAAVLQAGLVIIVLSLGAGIDWTGIVCMIFFAWMWWRRRKDKRRVKQLIGNKVRAVKARMARELADRSIPAPSRG